MVKVNLLIISCLFNYFCPTTSQNIGVFLRSEYTYLSSQISNKTYSILLITPTASPYTSITQINQDVKYYASMNLTVLIGSYSYLGSLLADYLNIPYYMTSYNYENNLSNNLFKVAIDDLVIGKAITEILKYYGITSITLITDNSTRSDIYLKSFVNQFFKVVFLSINDTTFSIQAALNSGKSSNSKNAYIVIFSASQRNLLTVTIQNALYLSMMLTNSLWILPEFTNRKPYMVDDDDTIFMEPTYLFPLYRSNNKILAFSTYENKFTTFSQLNNAIMIDSFNHYRKAKNLYNSSSVIQNVLKTVYYGISGTLSFNSNRQRNNSALTILAPIDEDPESLTWVGTYNESQVDPYKYMDIYNQPLKDIIVYIGVIEQKPQIYKNIDGTWTGMNHAIITDLAEKLKFTFQYVEPDKPEYGVLNTTTNSWSGLKGLLYNGEVQFLGNLFIKSDSLPANSFFMESTSILRLGYNILTRSAIDGQWEYLKLLSPFSWFVWIAIIGIGIVMSFVLWVTDKISPNNKQRQSMYSIGDAVFLVFGSLVLAKMETNPRMLSARVFMFFLWLGAILFVASYVATLTAFLVNPYYQLPFSNIETLLTNGPEQGFQWMFGRNDTAVDVFLNDDYGDTFYGKTVSYAKENWPQTMYVNGTGDAVRDTVLNNKNGKTVFIGSGLFNDYLQYTNEGCLLKTIGDYEAFQDLVFLFDIEMPQVNDVLAELVKMKNNQIFEKYKQQYYKSGKCSPTVIEMMTSSTPLTIQSLVGIFILLGAGIVLGFIMVLLEFTINKIILQCRRMNVPKLEFGKTYKGTITAIDPDGVTITIVKRPNPYFLSNASLHSDPKKIFTAHDLRLKVGSHINVRFFGKDPISGAKRFTRIT